MPFESSGKMTLVGEAGGSTDNGQWGVRRRQLSGGELNAEVADIFSGRAMVKLPEDAGQVHRVDPNYIGYIGQTRVFRKVRV